MADIIEFRARPRPSPRKSTLCRQGHHKWEVQKETRFDVKEGKLVSVWRCARCGKTRVRAK